MFVFQRSLDNLCCRQRYAIWSNKSNWLYFDDKNPLCSVYGKVGRIFNYVIIPYLPPSYFPSASSCKSKGESWAPSLPRYRTEYCTFICGRRLNWPVVGVPVEDIALACICRRKIIMEIHSEDTIDARVVRALAGNNTRAANEQYYIAIVIQSL